MLYLLLFTISHADFANSLSLFLSLSLYSSFSPSLFLVAATQKYELI
jgi:hypothetical protein